jgi:hypothetical protein
MPAMVVAMALALGTGRSTARDTALQATEGMAMVAAVLSGRTMQPASTTPAHQSTTRRLSIHQLTASHHMRPTVLAAVMEEPTAAAMAREPSEVEGEAVRGNSRCWCSNSRSMSWCRSSLS